MERMNMKKLRNCFFKTCPKSGRIVGINKKNLFLKVCFPLLGLAAFIWFIIRVVPKPSRIAYPCQQVAAPLAISFLAFLGSTILGWRVCNSFLYFWHSRRFSKGIFVLILGLFTSGVLYIMSVDNSLLGQVINKQIDNGSDMGSFTPIDKPNNPMGLAKGIHPGRVAWAYDAKAANWNGENGFYWDASCNSQSRVCDMMEGAIISLTNQKTIDSAWRELFCTFNKNKGKGFVGYKKGERIAIKVNLNNNGGSNIVDATPQSVYALLHQLVDVMGIPQACIHVYDAQRRGISAIYNYVHSLYPAVIYQNWGGFIPNVIHYSSEISDSGSMSLAKVAFEADYMINMALLKRHSRPTDNWRDGAGQTAITGIGKNQFGSVGNVPPLHLSIRDWSKFRGMGSYNCIVDLMAHERVGGNTLLYLIDAMYPVPIHNGHAVRFQRSPFNGRWSSSFLASNDPVAIESVALDFLYSEMPLAANADNFLHEAANIGNAPSGIAYLGRSKNSLGVHEHWNNPLERQYSRNLGIGNGIELYHVSLNDFRPAIESFYADRMYSIDNRPVTLFWETTYGDEVRLDNKKVQALGKLELPDNKTKIYSLVVRKKGMTDAMQKIVIQRFKTIGIYDVKDAELKGSVKVMPEAGIEFIGDKSTSTGSLGWVIDTPGTGNYYVMVTYSGTSPVPSYLYLNGQLISENIGYTVTSAQERKDFLFPVLLNYGKNIIRLEHAGKRSNRIYSMSLLKEQL